MHKAGDAAYLGLSLLHAKCPELLKYSTRQAAAEEAGAEGQTGENLVLQEPGKVAHADHSTPEQLRPVSLAIYPGTVSLAENPGTARLANPPRPAKQAGFAELRHQVLVLLVLFCLPFLQLLHVLLHALHVVLALALQFTLARLEPVVVLSQPMRRGGVLAEHCRGHLRRRHPPVRWERGTVHQWQLRRRRCRRREGGAHGGSLHLGPGRLLDVELGPRPRALGAAHSYGPPVHALEGELLARLHARGHHHLVRLLLRHALCAFARFGSACCAEPSPSDTGLRAFPLVVLGHA
mmetsp:Transcript_6863/g.17564  ORF Transcript_6863/g.17564 Transcript_6863/m.17564 type:complete len:293 (+) Transcript_6863:258-1136(+)